MRRSSTLTLADGTVVDVVRSTRRRRSVSAYREAGRTVLLAPDRMSVRELTQAAEELHARLIARESKRRPSDSALLARSTELAARWLDGQELPLSVRWVGNMRARWASCTPVDRAIRVSDRLKDAPDYVLDYVLVHELAHLLEPSHNARFWALVEPYPLTATARAWLDGFSAGQQQAPADPQASARATEPAPDEISDETSDEVPDEGVEPGGQGALFPLGGSSRSSSPDRSQATDPPEGAERSA